MLQAFLQAAIQHGHRNHGIRRESSCVQVLHVCQATGEVAEFLLVETIVDKGAASATVTVKSEDTSSVAAFADLYRSCLSGLARY